MQHGTSNKPAPYPRSRTTRRGAILWTAKLAAGVAAGSLPTGLWIQSARAQDDPVILIAGAAEVSASPGSAVARGAAAEAVAARGAARVQAAAALAEANSDDGAVAQGAVAVAAANPEVGAVAQSAVAVTSASSEDDVAGVPAPDVAQVAPAAQRVVAPTGRGGGGGRRLRGGGGGGGGGRVRGGGGGGRARGGGGGGGGRRMRGGVGGDRERRRGEAASLPSAGIGLEKPSSLTSFLAMASAAAAAGAAILRFRGEPVQVAEAVITVDN
jgi:hypothetical protein